MMAKKTRKLLLKSERTLRKEKIISFIMFMIASVFYLLPLIYMVGTSFKSDLDLQLHPESLFPSDWDQWTLEHYSGFIFRDGQIDSMPIWMLNSLWSTLATIGLTLLFDFMTAYAIVFLKFKGKNTLVKFLLLWMAVPAVIGTSSSFVIYATMKQNLGITGEIATYIYIYFWLIVPSTTGIFNMLLMRNFFQSIPKDIIDSAKSDGASNLQIFRKLVWPLAKSTTMLIFLFVFTGSWNNLVWPQLILTGENENWMTITVALTNYTSSSSSWGAAGVAMATSVFAMLPIIVIFLITQNKMIDGLASTGIKG